MRTDRSWWVMLLLGLITGGIYSVWVWATIGEDLNILMPEMKQTMNYWLVFFLLGPVTCGIWTLIWFSQISDKIGAAARKYGSPYTVSSSDFWIWFILLAITVVGPWIYISKVCKAMNAINAAYNARGGRTA